MDEFKEIRCKTCGTKTKPLFQLQPSLSSDDVYCNKCVADEREKRAKKAEGS